MKLGQIHKECQRKLAKAIQATYSDADAIINESFQEYYSQGRPPQYYQPTDTLKGTKNVESPNISGDTASVKVGYEGEQISYNTGSFDGGEVLAATMTGTYGVLGNPDYDENAFEKIKDKVKENFAKEFS